MVLEFVIRHATALSQPVFEDLNERLSLVLESGEGLVWETSNAPVFEAVLDVEESWMIGPDMTIAESIEWVEEMAARMVERMQGCVSDV